MSDIVVMELLSKEYGWLPSEIRKENFDDIVKYVITLNERRRIENKEMKKK